MDNNTTVTEQSSPDMVSLQAAPLEVKPVPLTPEQNAAALVENTFKTLYDAISLDPGSRNPDQQQLADGAETYGSMAHMTFDLQKQLGNKSTEVDWLIQRRRDGDNTPLTIQEVVAVAASRLKAERVVAKADRVNRLRTLLPDYVMTRAMEASNSQALTMLQQNHSKL